MQTFAAPESIPVPEFSECYVDGKYNVETADRLDTEYRTKLSEWAKAQGSHKLAGQFVSVPYADGAAEYCIVKLDGKVSLIHVPLGDAWHDDRFCRLATVAELTRMVDDARRFAEFWAKQPAPVPA